MNIYAIFPLLATLAYIPLLVTTVSSRPWQRRYTLFVLFLIAAMAWGLFDYFFRGNVFPGQIILVWKIALICFPVMATAFHAFTSSFFPRGQGRWLPFAFISLGAITVLTITGYIGEGVVVSGNKLYPDYGSGIIFIAAPLLILAARNFYVFSKTLRHLDNPVLYNQIIALVIGVIVIIFFSMLAILPWGREVPLSHLGAIINAFVLSYAVMRHQLVDIRIVLRQGSALVILAFFGAICYWLLLIFFHGIFDFVLDIRAAFSATVVAILVAAFLFRLRGFFFDTMSRAFQGEIYDYRGKLSNFTNTIQSIFSLKKQGGEFLELITRAVNVRHACLLFPEIGGTDFHAQIVEPRSGDNPLDMLKIRNDSPILKYLRQKQVPLMREELNIKPEFLGLWDQEKREIEELEIELFVPLISRDRLIALLAVGKKVSGRYSLEDVNLLVNVTERVAVSMEKEYLREELRQREEELRVLNRASAIITSSLDLQETFGGFIEEIRKAVDINWAAIILAEESGLFFLTVAPTSEAPWQIGERVPAKDSITEWVIRHKKTFVENNLTEQSKFTYGKYLSRHGVRSLVCLPLLVKGEAIGSLTIASRNRDAYSRQHLMLLEQLAFQTAMPVENARLYAQVEQKARVDELTGLLNRRSLDELIVNEIGRHSRYGGIFSLIILDLDNFKAYNDNYGHLAGDHLLQQIGIILKGAVRTADQAFRYGGDEFAILLPQTAVDAADRVAQRVRRQIALKVKSDQVPITASLGLACWPADGVTPNEIISSADAALYHAKRGGGNRSHCASGMLLNLEELPVVPNKSKEDNGILNTIYALAATVDARNPSSTDHSQKVNEYTQTLANALKLSSRDKNRLEIAALLHDIGKLGISDTILNKPDKLDEQEWVIIKEHPRLGAVIASRARQLAPCIAGILHHHERYDGTGYPKGLRGDQIPLDARILAIADAYTAMTSFRPYSETLSREDALAEIEGGAGSQFDPHLAQIFIAEMREQEVLPQK
ncbi:MAG: diguanylate cyclase [Chloroflexota bacterium]